MGLYNCKQLHTKCQVVNEAVVVSSSSLKAERVSNQQLEDDSAGSHVISVSQVSRICSAPPLRLVTLALLVVHQVEVLVARTLRITPRREHGHPGEGDLVDACREAREHPRHNIKLPVGAARAVCVVEVGGEVVKGDGVVANGGPGVPLGAGHQEAGVLGHPCLQLGQLCALLSILLLKLFQFLFHLLLPPFHISAQVIILLLKLLQLLLHIRHQVDHPHHYLLLHIPVLHCLHPWCQEEEESDEQPVGAHC